MKYVILLITIFLAGCPTQVVPEPPPPPEDTDWCGRAEERLEELQCHDLAGNPMWVNLSGEQFKSTCERAQEQGRIFLNPKCIANVATCEEANKCPTI